MENTQFEGSFQYTLDKAHVFNIQSQEDLISTLFQIEYTKQAQGESALACSKDCFEQWRQEDLSRPERDCLISCFSRSNALLDQFYSRTIKFNQTLQQQQ